VKSIVLYSSQNLNKISKREQLLEIFQILENLVSSGLYSISVHRCKDAATE